MTTAPADNPSEPKPTPGGAEHVPTRSPLWYTLQQAAGLLYATVFDYHVYGLDNVPTAGGAILAANHQSYLDPPAVAVSLSRPVSFMAKSELFSNRFFGRFISSLHAYPIRQGKGDRAAIVETVKRLQEGHMVNMYPEGARSDDGEIGPILSGVALVVRKAEVPVVPIVIDGTFDAWPKTRKLFRPGTIKVLFGPPLRLHPLPASEVLSVLGNVFRTMLTDLRSFPCGAAGEPLSARLSPVPELVWNQPSQSPRPGTATALGVAPHR